MAGSYYRFFTLSIAFLAVLSLASLANAQAKTEKNLDQTAKQRILEREAAYALKQFKLKYEKEGFYSSRVALNIWRSTAIDAGSFDPEMYDAFKKQLYEKSIHESLNCFKAFLLEENYKDANICLQTWRIHSKELGTYDKAQYESYKTMLTDAKKAKSSGAKSTQKAQD